MLLTKGIKSVLKEERQVSINRALIEIPFKAHKRVWLPGAATHSQDAAPSGQVRNSRLIVLNPFHPCFFNLYTTVQFINTDK